MFRYALNIVFKENKILIHPSVFYRILVILMAGFLTAILLLYGFSIPLLLLIIICCFSVFYEEKWNFDLSKKTVQYRNGLIFLAFSKTIGFDEIQSMEMEVIIRGKNSSSPIPNGRLSIGLIRNRRTITTFLAS